MPKITISIYLYINHYQPCVICLTCVIVRAKVNGVASNRLKIQMPVQRQVDKKREMLRRQLYGKEVMGSSPKAKSHSPTSSHHAYTYSTSSPKTTERGESTTGAYLVRDLTKIIILSALGFAIQFGLYFAINNHILKLPF
jgi:hypothetical protein